MLFRAGVFAHRRAVTIVELVIVVMILGILAAVATPTFYESLLYHRVESAARRVKADLELARSTARLKSTTQTLTFTGHRYTLGASVTGFDDPTNQYIVNLGEPPYEIKTVTVNFDGAQSVAFDGHGIPSAGGDVTLTCDGHRAKISLNAATGEVTISSTHLRGGGLPADN